MVHRITDGALDHACPCQKLLVVIRISGDIVLFDTGGAHQSPLIMIAGKPDLSDVGIGYIIRDILCIQMTVIIDDRTILRIVVIQSLCSCRFQHKLVIDQVSHTDLPLL